jgi:hypothetical protein
MGTMLSKVRNGKSSLVHASKCITAQLSTPGGLTKKDLFFNKNGRIVSAKKHKTASIERRLEKHGYFARKGRFGYVRKTQKKRALKNFVPNDM